MWMVVVWCICKLHLLGNALKPPSVGLPARHKAAHGCLESFLVVWMDLAMKLWRARLNHIQPKTIKTQYWM